MARMPTLFVSHGAPNLVLRNIPARQFLAELGQELPRPAAILVVTAHFETGVPAVTEDAAPATIHDFRGFGPELHRLRYPAPGSPTLAERAIGLLRSKGFAAEPAAGRGFDHGTWVPLMLLYPEADIPVVQLSVQPEAGPAHHRRLGQALAPLADEGVLVIGSGSLTHNLHEFFRGGFSADDPAPDWVAAFGEWMRERIEAGDEEALLAYRERAPHGARNHPTEEHLLPLFAALGAAGEGAAGRRVHTSHDYGVLMMDAYRFG